MFNDKLAPISILALYHFFQVKNCALLQEKLYNLCKKHNIKGTLLIAPEGINGTIAGNKTGTDAIYSYLIKIIKSDFLMKQSYADFNPFLRMKVRLKKEIVTMNQPDIDPQKMVGEYVSPQQWNELLQDPAVIVIDTRNIYECEIGTFAGAMNPQTNTFRELPDFIEKKLQPYKNKKIAMCCTGGIRCEKASSYMLSKGFKQVYHLQGGILNYLQSMPQKDSKWQGECFVFDNRVAVNHNLEVGSYDQCYGCRYPITNEDKLSNQYKKGVYCPKCFNQTSSKQKNNFAQRQKQMDLAKKQGIQHLG